MDNNPHLLQWISPSSHTHVLGQTAQGGVKNILVPHITEKEGNVERSMDPISRLLKDRIIILNGVVDENSALMVTSQLLLLAQQDPNADIQLYINSPGGSVTAGLAIKSTMDSIPCDVSTIAYGMAASMGAYLLSSGTLGKRFVLEDTTVMIHTLRGGGSNGSYFEKEQSFKYEAEMHRRLTQKIADNCGKTYEEMAKAMAYDNYMWDYQAVEFGLADGVIKPNAAKAQRIAALKLTPP